MASAPVRRKLLTQQERVAESARLLMDAAIELIAEQGYLRTTTAQIAERAGYSTSMVAERYGSKEALLETLMSKEYASRVIPDIHLGQGLDGLLRWLERSREEIRADPRLMRAFYTLVFESAGPVVSLRGWTSDWIDRCSDQAAAYLRAAQATGEIAPDVDIEEHADLFVDATIGIVFRFVFDGDVDRCEKALARLGDRFALLAHTP